MALRLKAHYHDAWEIETGKKIRFTPTGISDSCFYTKCNYHGKIRLDIFSNGMNVGTRCAKEKHPTACSQCEFGKLVEGEFYKALPISK
jgi:hypothetical protein